MCDCRNSSNHNHHKRAIHLSETAQGTLLMTGTFGLIALMGWVTAVYESTQGM